MQGLQQVVFVAGICHRKPNPVLDQLPLGEGAQVVANDYIFDPLASSVNNLRFIQNSCLYVFLNTAPKSERGFGVGLPKLCGAMGGARKRFTGWPWMARPGPSARRRSIKR